MTRENLNVCTLCEANKIRLVVLTSLMDYALSVLNHITSHNPPLPASFGNYEAVIWPLVASKK